MPVALFHRREREYAMSRKVHVFDNGVSVYDDHIIPAQRERYRKRNVHEAEEEDVFAELVRNLPPNACYINIGCAIGYYPILAKRLAPGLTVHAVEPLARHRDYFSENARLNGFGASDFAVHSQAISARAGMAPSSTRVTVARFGDEPRPPVSAKGFFRGVLTALGFGRGGPSTTRRPAEWFRPSRSTHSSNRSAERSIWSRWTCRASNSMFFAERRSRYAAGAWKRS